MKDTTKIDTTKIGKFLISLATEEYMYMKYCIEIRDSIQVLIMRHKLTKKDVCDIFKIMAQEYKNFTLGNYCYDVGDMAKLNATYIRLESEKLKETVPVKVK